MINIDSLISIRKTGDYQRDNYDAFLKKIRFSFDIPSIHITGTNGKGTVSSYIASIYQQAGYKVGLYTSPALNEVNEMIKVNGVKIDDNYIKSCINDYKKEIIKYELSSFEILTFVAFDYFKKQQCDICVIECGMGGEIDATNVFTPILSIISSVSLEHTMYLGKSISEIALQKAGIIKDEVPVLIGELPEEAINVISEEAKNRETHVYSVAEYHNAKFSNEGYKFTYGTLENLFIKSHALYSIKDACIALDAIEILKEEYPVDEDKIRQGLENVFMPCRMEILTKDPLTIIDGGHNPEAIEKVAKSLLNDFSDKPIHALFACFKDKNLMAMLSSLGACVDSITLTTFDHPRARDESDYFLYLSDYEFFNEPFEAYHHLKELYPEDYIIIIGSLAFAAFMKRGLKNE